MGGFCTVAESRPWRFLVASLPRARSWSFDSGEAAQNARNALTIGAESANEAGITVARLASDAPAATGASDRHVLVARASLADYLQAERLIADHGGQVILAADEKPLPAAQQGLAG